MKRVFIWIAIIWLSGCATTSVQTGLENIRTGPELEYQEAAISVKEKKYKEAAATYKKIVADAPESALAADAFFELALVHVHQNNPQRDYALATRTFEEFIKRYPDHERADEARTWISVLRTVQELKKQNEHLNDSIEELKQLDIRHEEKRKGK